MTDSLKGVQGMTPNTSSAAISGTEPTTLSPQGSKTTAVAIVETMPKRTPPQPFNLRSLVRTVADDLDTPDPHVIATEVLARIDTDDLADALALCLPDYVRKTVRVDLPAPEPKPSTTPVFEGSNGTRWASPKERDRFESRWEREKKQRVDPSNGLGEWTFLGDCTRGALLRLVEHRRREGDSNYAAADRYERLAKLLGNETDTVSALSADDVAGVA